MPQLTGIDTTCCIVGGGPAGMMLGYLLARAGIDAPRGQVERSGHELRLGLLALVVRGRGLHAIAEAGDVGDVRERREVVDGVHVGRQVLALALGGLVAASTT